MDQKALRDMLCAESKGIDVEGQLRHDKMKRPDLSKEFDALLALWTQYKKNRT